MSKYILIVKNGGYVGVDIKNNSMPYITVDYMDTHIWDNLQIAQGYRYGHKKEKEWIVAKLFGLDYQIVKEKKNETKI